MSTKELIYNAVSDLTEEDAQTLYSLIQLIFKKKETTLTDSQKAFQKLEKLKRPFNPPIDKEKEKEEYYRYLEEKYENLG